MSSMLQHRFFFFFAARCECGWSTFFFLNTTTASFPLFLRLPTSPVPPSPPPPHSKETSAHLDLLHPLRITHATPHSTSSCPWRRDSAPLRKRDAPFHGGSNSGHLQGARNSTLQVSGLGWRRPHLTPPDDDRSLTFG